MWRGWYIYLIITVSLFLLSFFCRTYLVRAILGRNIRDLRQEGFSGEDPRSWILGGKVLGGIWLCFHAWMKDLERKDVITLMLCWPASLEVTSMETAKRYVIIMEEEGNGRDSRGR